MAPAAAFLGDRDYLTPKLQAMDAGDFDSLVGRVRSADLAERWRASRDGNYAEDRVEDSRTKIKQAVDRVEQKLQGD